MSVSIDLPKISEAFKKVGEAYFALAEALSPVTTEPTPAEQRSEHARKAAQSRWHTAPIQTAAPVVDSHSPGAGIKGVSRLARELVIEDPTVTVNDLVERLTTRHNIDPALLRRTSLSTLRYDTLVTLNLVKEYAIAKGVFSGPGQGPPPTVRGADGRFVQGSSRKTE